MKWTYYLLPFLIASVIGCSSHQPSVEALGSATLLAARNVLYVSEDGDDRNHGSKTSPLASVQEAVDRARRNDAIKVMPGSYAGNIQLKSHIKLVGSGSDVTFITAEDGAVISARNAIDIVIEGFTLDGQDSATSGFMCHNEREVPYNHASAIIVFRENHVRNLLGHGIDLLYVRLLIEGCSIQSTVGDGIRTWRCNAEVRDTEVAFAENGIAISDHFGKVVGCKVQEVRMNGIVMHELTRCAIVGNEISNVGNHGVMCEYSSPVIRDNIITNCGISGIYCLGDVDSHSGPKIRRNRITSNGRCGVYIDQFSWPDLGRTDDHGLNCIHDNRQFAVDCASARVAPAVGNWWGTPSPSPQLFYGNIDHSEALCSPPVTE